MNCRREKEVYSDVPYPFLQPQAITAAVIPVLAQEKIDKKEDQVSERRPVLQVSIKEAEDTYLNIVSKLISLGLAN